MNQTCYIIAPVDAAPSTLCGTMHTGNTNAVEARSSVGERHLDVVDVVGSIPSAPTNIKG